MKKHILYIFVVAAAVTGCRNFLEEAPLTAQSDELTLSTIEGVSKSTMGLYSTLAYSGWYGCDMIVSNELKTGNGKKSLTKDTGRLTRDYYINYSETYTYGALWSAAYYVVNSADEIIDKIDSTPGLGDAALLGNYKAECLFLRALGLFDLVRTFSQPYSYSTDASHPGVPIVLHKDLNARPGRNTVADVYKRIVTDLLDAEKLMDDKYSRSGTDPAAFVTKPAIQAFLSRVFLYMGRWQECADYATLVINSGKYKMWTAKDIYDEDSEDSVYWNDTQEEGEVIFEVYGKNSNSFDAYRDGVSYMTTPEGYGDAAVCRDLISLYDENDVRGKLFIVGTGDREGDFWTMKYRGKGDSNPDSNNIIVFRLSEMYLNRAEALCNGAVIEGATPGYDLSIITDNRGSAPATASKPGVRLERRKELCWEGHYWYDMARAGIAMTRKAVEQNVPTTVEYPSYKWAMPIPDREIAANVNLKQNEGY